MLYHIPNPKYLEHDVYDFQPTDQERSSKLYAYQNIQLENDSKHRIGISSGIFSQNCHIYTHLTTT